LYNCLIYSGIRDREWTRMNANGRLWWGEAPLWPYAVNETADVLDPNVLLRQNPCRGAVFSAAADNRRTVPRIFVPKQNRAATLKPAARRIDRSNKIMWRSPQSILRKHDKTCGSLAPPKSFIRVHSRFKTAAAIAYRLRVTSWLLDHRGAPLC
jgi:hypothetical protein